MRQNTTQMDDFGKIPPQATEFEEAILGAILTDKTAFDTSNILKPEYFYTDSNQRIYQSMIDLFTENKPIDLLTMTEKLKSKGELDIVGGQYYLMKIQSRVSSSANIEYHCAIIIQKYSLREIIRVSAMAIGEAYSDGTDPFELQSIVVNELEKNNIKSSREPEPLIKIATENIKDLIKIQADGLKVTGLNTGYSRLNSIGHGWQKSNLVILAGRPGAGKTALALNFAVNVAMQNKPVAVFSLEMSSKELVTRVMSMTTGVFGNLFKTADLTEQNWDYIHRTDFNKPIYIDDTPGLSLMEFKQKARKLKRKHKIELIVVDYLQLMSAFQKGQNREGEISTISRGLKHIAKELDIPVIALAQLSRDVEKSNRQPRLSDLRESGAIEQDADIVMFLDDPNADDKTIVNPAIDVIIAKHRNGACDIMKLEFNKLTQKFNDL